MLQPIIQAAQLLQARKTDDDVDTVCEMCNKMSSNQVIDSKNVAVSHIILTTFVIVRNMLSNKCFYISLLT